MRYKFTRHARSRFEERFGDKIVDGDLTKSLFIELRSAKPDNSIKNDTRFVLELHEAHGWASFEFLVTDEIVFVIRGEDLVTLYPRKYSRFHSQSKRFRK